MAKRSPGAAFYFVSSDFAGGVIGSPAHPTLKSFETVFVTPAQSHTSFLLRGGKARSLQLNPIGRMFPRAVGHPMSPRH